jgi:monoamine oxidase
MTGLAVALPMAGARHINVFPPNLERELALFQRNSLSEQTSDSRLMGESVMRGPIARRNFLGGVALALAPSLASVERVSANSRSQSRVGVESPLDADRTDKAMYEVIIVGAGVSGLAAAKSLALDKHRAVVLEANNRLGGRILTDRSSGVALDLGASWVHGVRGNPITSLLEKAGAILHKTNWNSFALYYRGEEVEEDLRSGEFIRWTEQLKRGAKADMSLSTALERYLAEKNLSGKREFLMRHLVSTDIETEFGASIHDMSLKSFNEDDEFKGGDALVSSGYDVLIDSLAQGADVQLNTTVEAIKDTGTGVVVAAGQREFSARYALVTVPLGVLQKGAITFSPSLSRAKTKALQGLGMGNLHKTYLEFDHQFWDDVQAFGVAHGDTAWREFINLRKETGRPILLALHAGEAATRLQGMSGDAIAQQALSVLRMAYPRAVHPIRVTTTGWETDPYSLGSYSFVPVNGSMDLYDEMAEPEGRLFFAGEHTNSSYPSTVHGAYLSGLRAAEFLKREIKQACP